MKATLSLTVAAIVLAGCNPMETGNDVGRRVTEEFEDDYGVDNSAYVFDNIAMNLKAKWQNPGGVSWMDSYSIVASTGKEYCFIDSTLDHDIGELKIDLPEGGKISVKDAHDSQTDHPHYRARTENVDPIYNDVQCGNGPANDAGDEDVDQCPGRTDMGAGGCGIQGPRFTLVK